MSSVKTLANDTTSAKKTVAIADITLQDIDAVNMLPLLLLLLLLLQPPAKLATARQQVL
jgi:hypothetical protein